MLVTDLEQRPHDSANLLDYSRPDWSAQIDALRVKVGSPNNPELFPPHFLKKTLPSIGGKVIDLGNSGAAFLFPDTQEGNGFVARIHTQENVKDQEVVIRALLQRNKIDKPVRAHPYENLNSRAEAIDILLGGDVRVQTPTIEMGEQVRNLQRTIWGVVSDDFLYPSDIHSAEFNLATSLIAIDGTNPVGFLFGFHKFSAEPKPRQLEGLIGEWQLREESQLMGVLPGLRDHNVGFNLKRLQAEAAKQRGIELVNWTVDPLQARNAALNINKLGGVVWEHHPDYYSFAGANALNQVAASRFSISWMVGSERVVGSLDQTTSRTNKVVEIKSGDIPLVTHTEDRGDGRRIIRDQFTTGVSTSAIGIEIPVNWDAIQGNDLALAQQWRGVTDEVFGHYVGLSEGKYVLSDVAVDKQGGEIKGVYLIGTRSENIDSVYLNR